MEAFAAKQLQRSGRSDQSHAASGAGVGIIRGLVAAARGNVSATVALRGDQRPLARHGGGFEVRVFAFRMGGHERRVAISAAADAASQYKNVAFSIGFWN